MFLEKLVYQALPSKEADEIQKEDGRTQKKEEVAILRDEIRALKWTKNKLRNWMVKEFSSCRQQETMKKKRSNFVAESKCFKRASVLCPGAGGAD